MMESYPIDKYHKKPYYVVSGDFHMRYIRRAEEDLIRSCNIKNFSNKTKKHFGFVCVFRKVATGRTHPNYPYYPECTYEHRIEIHNFQKLFSFRLKHGL